MKGIKFGFGVAIGAFLMLQGCNVQYGYDARGWNNNGGHYHNGRYYGRNHDHSRGYYGGRDGRGSYDGRIDVRIGGGRRGYALNEAQDSPSMLAKDYGIRRESAIRILDLTDGQDSNSDLKAVGLKISDLKPLNDGQMPSHETIQKIAEAINESPSKVQGVMEGFIADTQK